MASSQVKPADATARVTHYLDALRGHDYPAAYDDLCMERQDKQTEKEFARAQADQTDISSYQVGTPVQRRDGFAVPADVEAVRRPDRPGHLRPGPGQPGRTADLFGHSVVCGRSGCAQIFAQPGVAVEPRRGLIRPP